MGRNLVGLFREEEFVEIDPNAKRFTINDHLYVRYAFPLDGLDRYRPLIPFCAGIQF